jgi:alpha-mannosidase
LTFDPSPLIRWQVELDGSGADYRVEMVLETAQTGQILAGMPFDMVPRRPADRDLLPRHLDRRLAEVLLGQRELVETRTFPFHDYIAITDGAIPDSLKWAAVFAQGLHAYQANENGSISITLARAVEWLTRADLEHRVGDAGPFFYVPDARGERTVIHDLAVLPSDAGIQGSQFLSLNAAFQTPPLLVEARTAGSDTEWAFFQEALPLSSLHIANGHSLARLYNPTGSPFPLSKAYIQTDVYGQPLGETAAVPPRGIVTLSLGKDGASLRDDASLRDGASLRAKPSSHARLLNPIAWHVGQNRGLPDAAMIHQLKEKIALLEREIQGIAEKLPQAAERERYVVQHQLYVRQRELLEYRLSARLNEIKLGMQGEITRAYLFEPDEEVASIGSELNKLRIMRRIYDYVIQAVGVTQE